MRLVRFGPFPSKKSLAREQTRVRFFGTLYQTVVSRRLATGCSQRYGGLPRRFSIPGCSGPKFGVATRGNTRGLSILQPFRGENHDGQSTSDVHAQARRTGPKALLRVLLRAWGSEHEKVAAVFGAERAACGAGGGASFAKGRTAFRSGCLPPKEPTTEVASLCDRVCVRRGNHGIVWQAQKELWRRWVAISAASWNGKPRNWLLKLAPFLVPPFRAVFVNASGDSLAGTPSDVLLHCRRGFAGRASLPEERAFIFRVLSQPELRALGPRDGPLSRGTIAFVRKGARATRPRGAVQGSGGLAFSALSADAWWGGRMSTCAARWRIASISPW